MIKYVPEIKGEYDRSPMCMCGLSAEEYEKYSDKDPNYEDDEY